MLDFDFVIDGNLASKNPKRKRDQRDIKHEKPEYKK